MRVTSWVKHLRKRRGSQFVKQMLRMWKFHRTSFEDILNNIFDELDQYNAGFTFPTIGSVALHRPELVRQIIKNKHEVASHGYKHVKYSFLSDHEQEKEFKLASKAFRKLKIEIKGFRAPYNNYNETTINLVQKYNFQWDGGIGYRPENRKKREFFRTQVNDKKGKFTCIPLNYHTDDLLIDGYRLTTDQISKVLQREISKIASSGGVLMFDLHPIRIGQKWYAPILSSIVNYANQLNGWVPTVSEGLDYWQKHGKWKGNAKFCLLLTGDIDNFVFIDYLYRLF